MDLNYLIQITKYALIEISFLVIVLIRRHLSHPIKLIKFEDQLQLAQFKIKGEFNDP